MGGNQEGKVFVGNLRRDMDIRKEDLQKEFEGIGRIENDGVWIARQPPGFAFITFENADDADKAVKEMDGKKSEFAEDSGMRVEKKTGRGGKGGGKSWGKGWDDWGKGYGKGKGYDDWGASSRGYGRSRSRGRDNSRGRDRRRDSRDRRDRRRDSRDRRDRSRGRY